MLRQMRLGQLHLHDRFATHPNAQSLDQVRQLDLAIELLMLQECDLLFAHALGNANAQADADEARRDISLINTKTRRHRSTERRSDLSLFSIRMKLSLCLCASVFL